MFSTNLKTLAVTLLCLSFLVIIATEATAGWLELLTHGSSGYINNAYFVQVDSEHSTGTGVIQPFLRIQKNGVEQGYNTAYSPKEFPETSDPWTRPLLLTEVPVVYLEEDGRYYREFLLDINEAGGGDEYLSLDELQIFLGDRPDLTGFPSGLGTLIYDMDAGPEGDMSIYLDFSLESGSGDGDMLAYIPNELFTGHQGEYVYLYSMFGLQGTKTNGLGSSDGFEEWAVREHLPVPEPAGLPAVAIGLVSMAGYCTRRLRR